MIKQLTKDDIPFCLSVISAENKISGTTPLDSERQINYLNHCIQDTDKYRVLGYFENDQLISWINIGFYEGNTYGKFWILLNLFSTKKRGYFSFKNQVIFINHYIN